MSEQLLTQNNIEYIVYEYTEPTADEAAGVVAAVFGAIAYVIGGVGSAVAAGAMAVSSVVTAGIAGVVGTGALATTLGGIVGNAAMGALISAGAAYASGARGAAVWRAAGMGGLTAGALSGVGALAHGAAGATQGAAQGASTVAAAPGATGAIGTATAGINGTTAGAGTAVTGVSGASAVSPTMANSITSMFGNLDSTAINRIGQVLINAAVNGQSMGRLDGLVAQQRAELEALRQSDRAAYEQRISEAQKILSDADRMDPSWYARTRMADVAGMEANQFKQAMRNIMVRQGGSFDSGQLKAYERGQALHTARSKALAYNQGFVEATGTQNQLRAQGAALLGPDDASFRNLSAQSELLAAQERAHREADNSTWGGVAAGLFSDQYKPATSPDPSANQQDEDPFNRAKNNPFGSGG